MLGLPRVLGAALDTRVGTTPCEVVFRMGTMALYKYRRETPARYAEPVLFCYALINRPYILDLQPDKSVVRRYLDQGFDVYMIDWGIPTYADRTLTLEDYVCKRLRTVVELVLGQHECAALHLLGYCMGGTMGILFAALEPSYVKTLTLLAAPIDFGSDESVLNIWANRENFDVDAFVERNGNCPAWFLQLCFLCTKPVQNLLEKNITFYEQMDDPKFLSGYFAMERWVNDNIPVAGETFREFVKKLYQENQLARGVFHLGDRHVDLRRVTCPLLLLIAKNDHLVPPASTSPVKAYVDSLDLKEMLIDAGHVGLVVSSRAHKSMWPEATRWLAERATPASGDELAGLGRSGPTS